jgi:acetyltransferase-like isoleucine patch superfamily enzyme
LKQIVIVNAKGFGEEVATWIQLMSGYGVDFVLKGFLDNRTFAQTILPIIGTPEVYVPTKHDSLVIALADPVSKKKVAERFDLLCTDFFTVIHPSNVISSTATIGRGGIIAPMNSISENVVLEPFVTIYGFCKIGHDVHIGAYSHLASHCSLDGQSQTAELTFLPSFTKLEKGVQFL